MGGMKLTIHKFCERVPKKLLKLIEPMSEWVLGAKKGENTGKSGGVFFIEGSRGSGKSQSMQRICGELLLDGYAKEMTIGILTQSAINTSIAALCDEIFDGYINHEKDIKNPPYRELNNGAKIYFQGFHPSRKSALKGTQAGASILIIDEVEDWGVKAAADTLNTYIRHGGLIILISNHFSKDLLDWGKSMNMKYTRIDYWENPNLDKRTLDGWEKLKEQNPEYWRATVLYEETSKYPTLYNSYVRDLFFDKREITNGRAFSRILSVDVALGGVDRSVISVCDVYGGGNKKLWIYGSYENLSFDMLIGHIIEAIDEITPNIIVVDSVGQGLPVKQRLETMYGNRVIGYMGSERGDERGYNLRSASYCKLEEDIRKDKCKFFGTMGENELQLEMKFAIMGKERDGKILMADKTSVIKPLLGGKSPDYLDSIVMANWYSDKILGYNEPIGINNKFYIDIQTDW